VVRRASSAIYPANGLCAAPYESSAFSRPCLPGSRLSIPPYQANQLLEAWKRFQDCQCLHDPRIPAQLIGLPIGFLPISHLWIDIEEEGHRDHGKEHPVPRETSDFVSKEPPRNGVRIRCPHEAAKHAAPSSVVNKVAHDQEHLHRSEVCA